MSDKDEVRRVQELRRSSAASPVDRSMTRSQERRLAIQEFNEDGSCKGRCPYGTCGGGPEACGGCCSCMGCEIASENALLASDEALRRTDPEWSPEETP